MSGLPKLLILVSFASPKLNFPPLLNFNEPGNNLEITLPYTSMCAAPAYTILLFCSNSSRVNISCK